LRLPLPPPPLNPQVPVLADKAFAALFKALDVTPKQLLANKDLLAKVLSYHVVTAVAKAADLENGQKLKSLQGQIIKVASAKSKVTLISSTGSKAKVVMADVPAGKAVVHVIDTVLVPKL
jgi:uncharacterized surface protein with fasciclin (FAS1) repeats